MQVIILLLFFIYDVIKITGTARILAVFPTPSISHQVVFRPLTQELARRGHEVVVITTDPAFPKAEAPANLIEIDVHDISYKTWREHFVATVTGKTDLYTQVKTVLDLFLIIFENQMLHDEVQAIIKDKTKTFDLLMVEACVKPALGLSYVYKVPVIQVSSFGANVDNIDPIGAPTHPLLYPDVMHQKLYNLTIWEKIFEIKNHYQMQNHYLEHEIVENNVLRNIFGYDTPELSELKRNVHMLFLSVLTMWEGNYPVPPTVVYIGGMHQKPKKEIPQDLKAFLDLSKHGVIYMSFGTNINPSSLPPEKIKMFVNVFSQLPYDILWKWDKDELPGQSKNIRIGNWFPQSDVLRHPNIKLFITQGGLQSTDEAIAAGVPLVGIPMLADQWFNVEKYVYHRIGIRIDLESLTEEKFRDGINTIIGDKSYKENIRRLNTLMRDQPQPGLERAVWWTEYVLRYGGARHLRAPAANISWAQYLELELVTVLIYIFMLGMLLISGILHVIKKFVSSPVLKIKEH